MKRQGQQLWGHFYTDTFTSSMSQQSDKEPLDRLLHKAIKENNAELILPKEDQHLSQDTETYNEEKELMTVVVGMRKNYDLTRTESEQLQKKVRRMEEEREQLKTKIVEFEQGSIRTKQSLDDVWSRNREWQQLAEGADYQKSVILHMKEVLSHDILYTKKQCFDENVRLIRISTQLKELLQRNTHRKHLKSKCKLILNSLQQTVQTREAERSTHLDQVEGLLRRKMENTQIKTNRQLFLEQSMIQAMQDRLPDEKFLLKKLHCELMLRGLLRCKMKKMIEQYSEVETCFNAVRKATRVISTNEFIDQFVRKEQRYGQLLESIQRSEEKIEKEKKLMGQLQSEQQELEYSSYELQKLVEGDPLREGQDSMRKLESCNEQAMHCQQLSIMLRRWAVSTFIRFRNSDSYLNKHYSYSEYVQQLQNVSLNKLILSNVKNIQQSMEDKPEQGLPASPVKSELTTQRTEEKLKLPDLTGDSVLSKQYSRRNFRIKTVASGHEEGFDERDHEYDEGSEFDFLKYNRRAVKKNNRVVTRARIKTRAY